MGGFFGSIVIVFLCFISVCLSIISVYFLFETCKEVRRFNRLNKMASRLDDYRNNAKSGD